MCVSSAGCSVAIYRVYVHVIKETGLHHYNERDLLAALSASVQSLTVIKRCHRHQLP